MGETQLLCSTWISCVVQTPGLSLESDTSLPSAGKHGLCSPSGMERYMELSAEEETQKRKLEQAPTERSSGIGNFMTWYMLMLQKEHMAAEEASARGLLAAEDECVCKDEEQQHRHNMQFLKGHMSSGSWTQHDMGRLP
jgi:hypothetical protein